MIPNNEKGPNEGAREMIDLAAKLNEAAESVNPLAREKSPSKDRFVTLEHRSYRIDDILNRRHPDPDPEDNGPLPPAEPALPHFEFDRDKLVLITQVPAEIVEPPIKGSKASPCDCRLTLDLTSLVSKDLVPRWPNNPRARRFQVREWWKQNGALLWDEIEAAAWEVFWNRRHCRSRVLGEDLADFDLAETLESGATLDWELGAIIPPEANRQRTGAVPIFDIKGDDSDLYCDTELLLNRFLCRGGSWLLTGPTGIGKSSLIMQMAISWALGTREFGFKPARPLATLIIQAENDAGDIEEQRDGVVKEFNLTEEQEAIVNEMVSIATVDDVTGPAFFTRLKKLIRDWQPDIIVLDPLLAYVGGDVNKQEVAADFLRRQLNPILHKANVAAIIVHHTGKPPRDTKFKDQANPDYAGLGSSELSNWARAIANLAPEGDVFCLTLGKRGKRAGIQDQFGATRVWLRHHENRIYWQQTDATTAKTDKRTKTADDLLPLVPAPPGRILKKSLMAKAHEAGIAVNRIGGLLDELIDAAKVYVHKEKRSGTNPLQYIARHPQAPQPEGVSRHEAEQFEFDDLK